MRLEAERLHRFSVADYYRLAEIGILAPTARVELLNGTIYNMPPIGPLHSSVETQLQTFFVIASKGRWIVRVQNPVRLNDGSEPIPDLALVRPRKDYYAKKHPQPTEVFLLIEVVRRSLSFDRREKLIAYALAGIQEYWIVNLKARSTEMHIGPLPIGEYSRTNRVKISDTVSPQAFPDLQINVADLF